MSRFLVQILLTTAGIERNRFVEYCKGRIENKPFENETERTVFVSTPVAVLKKTVIDEFLIDDIISIVTRYDMDSALKRLDELFRSSSLYSENNENSVLLLLSEHCRMLEY